MPARNLVLLGPLILGIAAIILAAVVLAKSHELSLPLPASLPTLNILLSFLTAVTFPLSQRLLTQLKNHALRLALPYLASASTLAPFVLLILSLVYSVPSDLQTCAANEHWLRMFENKAASSIRAIQTRLQCCGLNTMHDRAWPFPDRNNDARVCERTQGYTRACGGVWRQEEMIAAVLTAIASLLNWIMLVLLANLPREQGHIRLPASSSHPQRLLGGNDNHVDDHDSPTHEQNDRIIYQDEEEATHSAG